MTRGRGGSGAEVSVNQIQARSYSGEKNLFVMFSASATLGLMSILLITKNLTICE